MITSIERIVQIMACMHGYNAEVVAEDDCCYLFFGEQRTRMEISDDEVSCLVENEIIELDGGSSDIVEGDLETFVYHLTSQAQDRIAEILKNKEMLVIGP